jgi:hypothetical protein
MRAFFCLRIGAVLFRAPSRASPLPQLTESFKQTRSKVGAGSPAKGLPTYQLETRYTRSSSRVRPFSMNFPFSLSTS